MNVLDDYLVRAHQADLLRAAARSRPSEGRLRRPRRFRPNA
jgi:hypothetical protein